jgi:hypothetical protein
MNLPVSERAEHWPVHGRGCVYFKHQLATNSGHIVQPSNGTPAWYSKGLWRCAIVSAICYRALTLELGALVNLGGVRFGRISGCVGLLHLGGRDEAEGFLVPGSGFTLRLLS